MDESNSTFKIQNSKFPNFLAIDEEFSNFEDSQIVILPIPYEHSTSYGKGTKYGPEAILKASAYVEFYDDETEKELCFDKKIATLDPKVLGIRDQELGRMENDNSKLRITNYELRTSDSEYYHTNSKLKTQNSKLKTQNPTPNTQHPTPNTPKEVLAIIESKVSGLLVKDKFVVCLGGEHTISIALIKAHLAKFPDMSILHFDAHSDLRQSYEGSEYSHACFMARVSDFFPPERITQVGIRAQCIEEAKFIKDKKINTFYASAIRRGIYGSDWINKVIATLEKNVYVTFDVDYFDPSVIPSTGTPEPDGFYYNETLEIFRELRKSGRNIIGLDVVELAPILGLHHADITISRLIYKILNYAFY